MVHTVAVCSSNTGGISRVNVGGGAWYLSCFGDMKENRKTDLYILSDEKRLKEFKRGAVRTAAKFDINKIVPMYEAIYEKALKEK